MAPDDPGRQQQERAARELAAELGSELLRQINRGANVAALGSSRELARTIVSRLPLAQNPWLDIVGPCYTSGALQRELGVGRAAVSKAVRELRILRLVTSDGVNLYPAFQVSDGALVPGLRQVLRTLAKGTQSSWTWAQWLNAVVEDETGRPLPRNIERLTAGELDRVLRDAQHDAAAWAA